MKKNTRHSAGGEPPSHNGNGGRSAPTGPTGRSLIVLNPNNPKHLARSLNNTAGLRVATSSDFEDGAVNEANLGDADALLLEHLNVAVVDGDADQIRSLQNAVSDESNPVLAVEPEEYVNASVSDAPEGMEGALSAFLTQQGRDYTRGYADAVRALTGNLLGSAAGNEEQGVSVATTFLDTAALTWGLQACRVNKSLKTGAGIRVAVLDTGFDLGHPDFAGRSMLTASFVPGEIVKDGHGHGTHCIGTSCGPHTPPGGARRYGIASQAIILVGKVLSNQGSGQDGWILAGINWAIQNHANVISMSLGAPVQVGQGFKQAYEQAAQVALNSGCLIVAAAGNSANMPVESPANCPSIMAVAALDSSLQHASFSSIGINPNGGEVNIAAPGVNVFSTIPMPQRYGFKSGTSMATPHVAGLAALWAQSTGLRGRALWTKLTSTAVNIGQTTQLIGAGMAVAPTSIIVIPHPIIPHQEEVPQIVSLERESVPSITS